MKLMSAARQRFAEQFCEVSSRAIHHREANDNSSLIRLAPQVGQRNPPDNANAGIGDLNGRACNVEAGHDGWLAQGRRAVLTCQSKSPFRRGYAGAVQHDCIRHDDYRSADFIGPMVSA